MPTRKLTTYLSTLLGYSLWKKTTKDGSKVVPSLFGILLSVGNLLLLVVAHFISENSGTEVPKQTEVKEIIGFIYQKFLLLLPFLLILTQWFHSFKCKRVFEILIRAKIISRNLKAEPSTRTNFWYQGQIYATLLAYISITILKQIYYWDTIQSQGYSLQFKIGISLQHLVILVFSFGSIFTLISYLAEVSRKINTVSDNLETSLM